MLVEIDGKRKDVIIIDNNHIYWNLLGTAAVVACRFYLRRLFRSRINVQLFLNV